MAMSRGRIEFYKEHYPRGTRVQLDSMGDDPCPVESGAVGTVITVDDIGTYEKKKIMESKKQKIFYVLKFMQCILHCTKKSIFF